MAEPLIWLRELDSARIQRYHYYTIVVAGLGLLTFGYSFFCSFLVIVLLRCMKAPSLPSPGDFYPVVHPSVDVSSLGGTLAGQLIFGLCCDKFGRKIVYEFILTLMVVCCCCSGLSFGTKVEAVLVTLYVFRFCLGFLGGATYSLAATFISENANKRKRGMFIAAGFAMQGLGTLFAGIAVIIISSTTIHKYHDFYWHILLMSVAVLPFGAYLLLKTMPETPRFTNFVSNNPSQAASDAYGALNLQLPSGQENAQHLNVGQNLTYHLFSREFWSSHGWHLLGIAGSSLVLGITSLSSLLFLNLIFRSKGLIPPAKGIDAIHEYQEIAKLQTLLLLPSFIGSMFAVFFIDCIGRVPMQNLGFFSKAVFMFATALSTPWEKESNISGLCVLYVLDNLFSSAGPNATVFALPAEIFPTKFRATCHAISVGAGKFGEIVAVILFRFVAHNDHKIIKILFFGLCVSNILAIIMTLFVPESKGKTLEELSGENEDHGARATELASSGRIAAV